MPLSEIVLIVIGLMTLAMLAAGLCRNLPVPYTVVLVIVGVYLMSKSGGTRGGESASSVGLLALLSGLTAGL